MEADDPRHGTSAGYNAGCREADCWRAKQRYDKRRRWEAQQGFARRVSSLGAKRRIQSLRAAGWSTSVLAAHLGITVSQIQDYGRYPTVYATTHRAIAEMFEALAFVEPPRGTKAERHGYTKSRRTAARHGWALPGAWFDIDDPDEQPDPGWRPSQYRSAELVAEWDHLRRAGVSIERAAAQLGVTVAAIEKAIERVRKVAA